MRDDHTEPGDSAEHNPLEDLLRQMGLIGPGQAVPPMEELLGKMQGQFTVWQQQMSSMFGAPAEGHAANWGMVKTTARQAVTAHGMDPTPTQADRTETRDASELVDSWLDDATTFVSPAPAEAISRAEWIEATIPVWSRMADPIVAHVAEALGQVLAQDQQMGALPIGGDFLTPMIRQAASAMFAGQMGKALGDLAAVTVSMTDIGLPLSTRPAILPRNVAVFCEGIDIPQRDLLMYLTIREMARQRLFGAVGWLAPQIMAYLEHYAREITIDPSALEDAVRSLESLDAEGLEQLSVTINGTLFTPEKTAEQEQILQRLEVLLALVEGWVDHVVSRAAGRWLPQLPALEELVRRRRAEGGPGETALATLVGLQMRPRRIRDAQNLWAAVENARGADGRDDVWKHPDLLPDAKALDDPLGWVAGEDQPVKDEFDLALEKLLDENEG